MALPFTVVAVGLALSLLFSDAGNAAQTVRGRLIRMVITGGFIGALYALNSWDYPTYLMLTAVALIVAGTRARKVGPLIAVLVLVTSSVLAWIPFFVRFVPPTGSDQSNLPAIIRDLPVIPSLLTSIVPYHGERTSLPEFLTIFAIPYLLGLWLVGTGFSSPTWAACRSPPTIGRGLRGPGERYVRHPPSSPGTRSRRNSARRGHSPPSLVPPSRPDDPSRPSYSPLGSPSLSSSSSSTFRTRSIAG